MSDITRYEEQSSYLQKLIDSKNLPAHIKTVESAFLIDNMGKELGFPTISAFQYIIPIQGKLTLSAKAIGAVLRKNGVKLRTTEDAVYVYPDGSTKKFYVAEPTKPIDRRTTIIFTRDGVDEEVSFHWSDAQAAGLDKKDNWVRMPREMLWARCLSKGATRVGQDLLLGLYSTDEMFDAMGNSKTRVIRDEDGQITSVVEVEHEVVVE
jgi:hypothetical protein